MSPLRRFKVLIVNNDLNAENAKGTACRKLIGELEKKETDVIGSLSIHDAESIVISDPGIDCFLLDWDIGEEESAHTEAVQLIEMLRSRNHLLPVFLMAERTAASAIPTGIMEKVSDFVWLLEDTPAFIAGRIVAAMGRYRRQIVPPFTAALAAFSQVYEYSWHTPGHTGGTAFLKSPVGLAFHEVYGEPLFRTDLSISVGALGSLLDHSGPIGESEKYAARVFGAHRSYTVTNGTSTSNRVVFMACVTDGEIALCDRNCHKSIEHSLTLTGARPVYLLPSRNYLGLIGPIHPEVLAKGAIQKAVKESTLAAEAKNKKPVHCVITNSTYDGLTYNVRRVLELLSPTVSRIHFDEAWYGYARFNPLYRDRYAMYGNPAGYHGPTVFATTSTHKLLAAFSQASFIHVRDGKDPVDHARFNESFMMHASTSPLYTIIASNEVSASMMDGPFGLALTTESIQEAVAFRKTMARIHAEFVAEGGWFFAPWQPDTVRDPATGVTMAFQDAPDSLLVTSPDAWVLHPGDDWHGFADLEDGYCMLDPIKVSIVTPGMSRKGKLEKRGIPASIVTAYLNNQGIVQEKTTDFTILFLFSLGITKGKWGTLVNALLSFKQDYDRNTPLTQVLPDLVESYPGRYGGMGLRDLSDEMFAAVASGRNTEWMAKAFSQLPEAEMTPREAYTRLVHNQVEHLLLDRLAGRIAATGVVPYPPGIPLLMPGENFGDKRGPILSYLRSLEAFDTQFPGFTHDTHGVEVEDGKYKVYALKSKDR
ncbi:MAG: arginine decarboxylase, partial [Methanomicrobiales archaeon]|nr:arginine decarboxylase [Methanomicrobiales archaeon]